MGATKTDGTLWMWGRHQYGQLGQNNLTQYSSPVQIPGTTWSHVLSPANYQLSAYKTDGTLWTWGYNNQGGLGHNIGPAPSGNRSSPIQISGTWSIPLGAFIGWHRGALKEP